MRIGVVFPQTEFGNDPLALRDYVQAVEGLGFTHFLVYDHVLSADISNRPDWTGPYYLAHPFHEVMVLLGHVAALSRTLELVTGVLILPQRQTVLVAKQAAAVDVLSGGRLRLGIGVGWNDVEFVALGKDFHDRGERSEEQIALMRELWTHESISFAGEWEQVEEAGIVPLPVQRPIPVWIGGYVEATLRRIGRIGDGWFPWREPNDIMKRSIEIINAEALAAGRDPNSIGYEPQLNVGKGSAAEWQTFVSGWRDLGATHLCLGTMGNGFTTPDQHLAALVRGAKELGVSS